MACSITYNTLGTPIPCWPYYRKYYPPATFIYATWNVPGLIANWNRASKWAVLQNLHCRNIMVEILHTKNPEYIVANVY